MSWRRLFTSCLFGHSPDPLMVLRGKAMHHECRRCLADLGPVLPDLAFNGRKAEGPNRKSLIGRQCAAVK